MDTVIESYKKNLTVCPLCFGNLVSKDDPEAVALGEDSWGSIHIACSNCFYFYLIMAFSNTRGLKWTTTEIVMNNTQMRGTLFKKKMHQLVLEHSGKDLAERISGIMTLI